MPQVTATSRFLRRRAARLTFITYVMVAFEVSRYALSTEKTLSSEPTIESKMGAVAHFNP